MITIATITPRPLWIIQRARLSGADMTTARRPPVSSDAQPDRNPAAASEVMSTAKPKKAMPATRVIALVGKASPTAAPIAALIALLGIIAIPAVGVVLIFPVNKIIKDGVADEAALVPLLKKWMRLNNIRWILATVMWGAAVWYIIAIGDFPHAV